MRLILGDCLERLVELEASSVDAVVTDPPYGWRFMGKAWDGADIEKHIKAPSKDEWRIASDGRRRRKRQGLDTPDMAAGTYDTSLAGNQAFMRWTADWATEALRVLKPGGHMLVFCGPRTYHAMAMGVEMAGFEIRDQLQWLFGSGFPKSLDVSKAIDKAAGAEREVVGHTHTHDIRNASLIGKVGTIDVPITAPATPDAKRWQGFGTALKPANEPIVLARKPLERGLTVAQNVLKWGTGALAIDACRIAGEKRSPEFKNPKSELGYHGGSSNKNLVDWDNTQGRWPANVLLDEEAAAALDAQSGVLKSGDGFAGGKTFHGEKYAKLKPMRTGDSGGASRFFYVAKASKRERNAGLEGMPEREKKTLGSFGDQSKFECPDGASRVGDKGTSVGANVHPTVKPLKLMEYLCRLITPPGGVVLDPFMGSGSTGCAAVKLGFKFIGIERESEYLEIARRRIEWWQASALRDQDTGEDADQLPLEPL